MRDLTPALPPMPNTNIGFPSSNMPPSITRQQKAAIIVRLLLSDGGELSLTDLPEAMQHNLTLQMGAVRIYHLYLAGRGSLNKVCLAHK